jgi:hypothetical protein
VESVIVRLVPAVPFSVGTETIPKINDINNSEIYLKIKKIIK